MSEYEEAVRAAQFKVDEAVRELNATVNADALPEGIMSFVGQWVVLIDERVYSTEGEFLDADVTAIGSPDQPPYIREAIIRRAAQTAMTPVAYVEVENDEDDE